MAIELKATNFKLEFAGKMNFYLSTVDDMMKYSAFSQSALQHLIKESFLAPTIPNFVFEDYGLMELEAHFRPEYEKNTQQRELKPFGVLKADNVASFVEIP